MAFAALYFLLSDAIVQTECVLLVAQLSFSALPGTFIVFSGGGGGGIQQEQMSVMSVVTL